MKLLLDTHLLLWASEQPDRRFRFARDLIADPLMARYQGLVRQV